MVDEHRLTDVDILLNLEAIAADVSAVAGPLQRLGMRPVEPRGPFHRFARGEDIVDVMVTNLAGPARWMSRPIMRAPGATLALQDPDIYIVKQTATTFRSPFLAHRQHSCSRPPPSRT